MEPTHTDLPRRRGPSPVTSSGFADAEPDALLHAVGRGDMSALRALYDTTAPAVFGLLRQVLRVQAAAERATEQVYLRLWRDAPLFDPETGCARSVLLSAVRTELVHRLREAGREHAPQGRVTGRPRGG